jgi:hypothetical protein
MTSATQPRLDSDTKPTTEAAPDPVSPVGSMMPTPAAPMADEYGMPTKEGWRKIGEFLRRPMPTKERPGGRGGTFKYITARQVQDRLDTVIGPGNWSTRYTLIDPSGPAVECQLTLFGVTKADVGYSNNPDSDHESEALKAAYSDSLKRAAVAWGVGRWIYGDVPA